MAEDVLSSFLIKIVYDQDERSRKKFDAGLKSIQDNAQEFGKKIEALPEIVHEATKKISLSLTSLYYAAQQTRATEQQLHAFSRGIKDSGGDVDQANASYKAFVEDLNLYGSGLTRSIQDITKVTVDAEHPMQGYIAVWDKLHEMFMRGGEDRAKAGKYAEAFNIPVEQLALGREQFHKSFLEDLGRTGAAYGEAAKQASLLQIALNKLEAAFSNVVTKADVAIMNDYGDALNGISVWIDDNQEKVIHFLKEVVEQFRIAFHELKETFGPSVEWLGGVIKDAFAALDKFLGNDDGGVKGLRIALESLFAMSLLAGLARLGATLTLAMLPVTKFMLAAMALGLLGAGAYALYRSYIDQDALVGGVGGWGLAEVAGEGMASGGHGAQRRGRFGHGGSASGGISSAGSGTIPSPGPSGSVYSMIDRAAGGDERVANAMKAIFEGESDHRKGVFDVGDYGTAFGPFQMNVAGGRLGAQFQKATGLDPRKPENQQAVANWVAKYIKDRPGLNIGSVWFGYPHGLERISRGQVHPNDTIMNLPAAKSIETTQGSPHWDPHFRSRIKSL